MCPHRLKMLIFASSAVLISNLVGKAFEIDLFQRQTIQKQTNNGRHARAKYHNPFKMVPSIVPSPNFPAIPQPNPLIQDHAQRP